MEPVEWSDLDGWTSDDHAAALDALLTSCSPIRAARPSAAMKSMARALRTVCHRAQLVGRGHSEAARVFFERNFRPARVSTLGESLGLVTGYYEPVVEGSRLPNREFTVPIYRRPDDLVLLNPRSEGQGFPNRAEVGRRVADRVVGPYFDRAQIENGALDGRHLEICWIRSPIDALFIQIEGSARVRLEDGLVLRLNYAAHNGFPFTPVGRILIDRHIIPREEMSTARIRQWMQANPAEAREVRQANRLFVFFRIVGLGDEGEPFGAQGVRLVPGRSIAVDKALHAYGTPFFIAADLPLTSDRPVDHFRRLMIAQDTGSAIVGPARADIFFGGGDEAGREAGRIRQRGQFFVLIPKEIDPAVERGIPLPRPKPNIIPLPRPRPNIQIGRELAQGVPSGRHPKAASRTRSATPAGHIHHPTTGLYRPRRSNWQ